MKNKKQGRPTTLFKNKHKSDKIALGRVTKFTVMSCGK
jgi:hypothetical protein